MPSKESLMILNKTRAMILLGKIFIKHYRYCCEGRKYSKFTWKRSKKKKKKNTHTHAMKKDHSKR